jgi:hypothetical protein
MPERNGASAIFSLAVETPILRTAKVEAIRQAVVKATMISRMVVLRKV